MSNNYHFFSLLPDDEISFDMEHFSTELDSLRKDPTSTTTTNNTGDGSGDKEKEEELVQLVVGILFAILWRGCVLPPARQQQRQQAGGQLMPTYGQSIAAINLLGNEKNSVAD